MAENMYVRRAVTYHCQLDFSVAKYCRGMYAVRVKGRIPEDVEAELENRGIKYRPRDGTEMD